MTLSDLKKLIANGESRELEFKKSTSQLKAAMETLCAYLNTSGGTVLIGVKNDGSLVGQNVTDQTRLELSNAITKVEPPADINVSYVKLDDQKQVIILTAKANPSLAHILMMAKLFGVLNHQQGLCPNNVISN